DVVVDTMRRGARDFVQKPWDNARLLAIVRNQLDLGRALRRSRDLEGTLARDGDRFDILSESAAMRTVMEMIRRVAPSDANVLIRGENGTGKGVVARAIHAASRRAAKQMVAVNADSLDERVITV